MKRYFVGITGASGSIYGARIVEALLADPEREVHLCVSPAARQVIAAELGAKLEAFLTIDGDQKSRLVFHAHDDIGAGPASGSWRHEGMIVAPCSVKTLGSLAAGLADNLISRAGDVAMKEGMPLVLVVRETPLSLIHLRNMVRVAEAGATILPASPGFYHKPQTIDDLVRQVVQKVFDRLGLQMADPIRWKAE
ncbi:UbiX family flavin prenyltransferase [bacterium]|nr:UbiX family flavin prenyltransferase [bacterium]